MQLLEISTRTYRRHTIVGLRGELDLAAADELRARLRAACHATENRLIIDLAELTFIDSTGLSILVDFHEKTRQAGGAMVLVAPPPSVVRVLDITGLDKYLLTADRLADAIAAVAGASRGQQAEGAEV